MIQDLVWDVSNLFMGLVATAFVFVAAGAHAQLADYGPAIAAAYRLRAWLFVLALIGLIGTNYRALGALPYISNLAEQPTARITRVDALGEQWSWNVTPSQFAVGQTVDFYVTSKDVNHGFGLYSPNMRIVAQTQAMPGYINILRYTFREPGTYHVLCLEYCGLAHHQMNTDIDVASH